MDEKRKWIQIVYVLTWVTNKTFQNQFLSKAILGEKFKTFYLCYEKEREEKLKDLGIGNRNLRKNIAK